MPVMNYQGDNLEEIYAWIDAFPFSRPKKNIPRDFSDGVLMAEVLKIHYPRYVNVHNYIPANNVAAKKENWITLNRKVFSKIDMKLSKDVVNQLANAQPGVIEKVLMDLRNKTLIKNSTPISNENNSIKIEYEENFDKEKTEDGGLQTSNTTIKNDEKIIIEDQKSSGATVLKIPSSNVAVTETTDNVIGKARDWISGWIWPFGGSSNSEEKKLSSSSIISSSDPKPREENSMIVIEKGITEDTGNTEAAADHQESSISRSDFLRLRQEVEEKNFAISMLNRKVSCLETAMKLKDKKIGNLAARISTSSETSSQNLRPHVMGSSISRLKYPQSKICS